MIAKGTKVFVVTTNGGHITGKLLENYVPTYYAVVECKHTKFGYLILSAERIRTISTVENTASEYGLHQSLYTTEQRETALRLAGDLELA